MDRMQQSSRSPLRRTRSLIGARGRRLARILLPPPPPEHTGRGAGDTQPAAGAAGGRGGPGPMEISVNCRLAGALAREMRGAREELTRRWLDRITARVAIEPNQVFPTNDLLDHVPLLVDRIADYLEDPADEIAADAP